MRRRLAAALLIAAGVLLCTVAGALIYIDHANLAGALHATAERLAGRPLRMTSLRVGLGRVVQVSIRELSMPAAADPALPEFLRASTAEILVEALPLLTGRLVVRSVAVDGMRMTLQRNRQGVGTWSPAGAGPPRPDAAPARPASLPTLLDVSIRDSEIVSIGSSGKPFRIRLDRAALHAATADDPVAMQVDGALQTVPVSLEGTTGSFRALQARPQPFRMALTVRSQRSTLSFDGTATDPLNFDGLDGAAKLDVPSLTELLRSAGSGAVADLPASLAGALTRADRDWQLHGARGMLDQAAFTGDIQLIEGGRGQADRIAPSLAFDTLDMGRILAAVHAGAGGPGELPEVSLDPDPRVNATLSAKLVVHGALRVADAAAHLAVEPGEIVLDETRFGFGGGRVSLSADGKPGGSGTHLTGTAAAQGVALREAFVAAGSKPPPANGPVSGQALFDITGRGWDEALAHGRVTAAVTMAGGTIRQNLVRQVALDVRSFFGGESGATRLDCLLAVVDLRNGAGNIGPVRLVTPDGAVDGWGELDMARDTIDMTVQSDRTTSGALALDIPIRITGRLESPAIAPSLEAARRRFGPARLGPWPAEITRFMQTSPCLRTR